MAPTQAFSCECCEFFRNNFFYVTTPVAAFMFTRKGRRRKRWTKELGKNFQLKEENENISFNFYLQVLVLAKTEMQTQLCKYYRTAHLFSYFFFKFSFLWFLRIHFCVFPFLTNWKIPLVAFISIFRSRHWELFRKTATRKDITKTINFVLENWSFSVQFTK